MTGRGGEDIRSDTKTHKRALVDGYVAEGLLPRAYEREDFIAGTEPYEHLHSLRGNPFAHNRTMAMLTDAAIAVGYIGFRKTYTEYERSLKQLVVDVGDLENITMFEGQPLQLSTGEWVANDDGIYRPGGWEGDNIACVHPVLPIQRLINIDSGIEKLVLAYRKGGFWRKVVADKKTLASTNSIVELANVGIAVNSDNCRALIKYIHDVENLNYDAIPEKRSISRMGWIEDGSFAPYIDDIEFDAEMSYKAIFDSIKQSGSHDDWIALARSVRKGKAIQPRVMLAAAFASVLVQPLNALPFFVHAWGGTGVGKTVGVMLATSVWADPQKGKYWRTFDSTAVGQEKSAGFLNSLPLILDELQLVADKKSFDKMIYSLSEGVGRSRGSKTGGLQKLETWGNAILTTGEKPLTSLASGGGAVNRVLDMECKEQFFKDPKQAVNILRKNYGHAGKIFVDKLSSFENTEHAETLLNDYYAELISGDTTEKQAQAAALVLTADVLATEWIFKDEASLQPHDIKDFLQSKQDVNVNARAHQYIREVVATNPMRFNERDNPGEVWGYIHDDCVFFVRSVFGRILQDSGYDAQSLLSWMADNDLCVQTYEPTRKRYVPTKVIKTSGIPVRYVIMKPDDSEDEDFEVL